eukprot:2077324-Amphidinium_carterae.1
MRRSGQSSQEEPSSSEGQRDVPELEEQNSSSDVASSVSLGAMAMVFDEVKDVCACATKTGKTPMFLDPAGKAYALADSAATKLGWAATDPKLWNDNLGWAATMEGQLGMGCH